jgi:DNA-binding CsgD family transcriptional regulator
MEGHPRVVLVEGEAGIGKSSLLNRFCEEPTGVRLLRAAGADSERLLAYGVVGQLLGGELPDGSRDPLTVGMEVLSVLDREQGRDRGVVVAVDDLDAADDQSVCALLFASRRLQSDRVLVLATARSGKLAGVEEGWGRFASGDGRAARIQLGGLGAADVQALAELLEVGRLPLPVASRLVEHTGGNPLYCRALLEELGSRGVGDADVVLPAPRVLGSMISSRVARLSGSAQRLVAVAAVLGGRCALRSAAGLAGLDDPVEALEEAAAAGLVSEEGVGAGAEVVFAHPLIRAAVYGDMGPARRREMHARAGRLLAGVPGLMHRVAAGAGPDDVLARDLEVAARDARARGQRAQAATWLEQAAGASGLTDERVRLLLDALEVTVTTADVGRGLALEAGHGDPGVELVCRSHSALCDVALRGREGLRGFDHLPSDSAAVPLESTDALTLRGEARLLCDELPGALEDLRVVAARVSGGVPLGDPSRSLALLAHAEFQLGRWDDAVVHGELAVSLSRDAHRAWDYAFVHGCAALVPAARGEWDRAAAHVAASRLAAEAVGVTTATVAAATARAALAHARGDRVAVLDAVAAVRRTGHAEMLGPGTWIWQLFEVDALLDLNRCEEARGLLAGLERYAAQHDLASSSVAAAGLRGRLAALEGDQHRAELAFDRGWKHADGLRNPFLVAWLGMADGRRLRTAGKRGEAIARLKAAREVLARLGARPYLDGCDEELRACGVHGVGGGADRAELTRAELRVARLVAAGHSNKEVAAELFVSVKTVEFHLRHAYQKLGIRSRVALAGWLGAEGQQD